MKAPIKTYTLKSLSYLFGMSPVSFRKKLKQAGLYNKIGKRKRFFYPNEVKRIFEFFGHPDVSEEIYKIL